MSCDCKEKEQQIEKLQREKQAQEAHQKGTELSYKQMHKEMIQAQAQVQMLMDAITNQKDSFKRAHEVVIECLNHWCGEVGPQLIKLGLSGKEIQTIFQTLPNNWPKIL